MVDIADFDRFSALISERRQAEAALAGIASGAKIVTMIMEGDGTPPQQYFVNVRGMDYPQQMVDTIKSGIEQRLDQIADELAGLGVTGVAGGRK